MSSAYPLLSRRVAELGRNPVQDTSTVWFTRLVVLLTVTFASGPAPGAGTVTAPVAFAPAAADVAAVPATTVSSTTAAAVAAARRCGPAIPWTGFMFEHSLCHWVVDGRERGGWAPPAIRG